jgi:hypothetical protein
MLRTVVDVAKRACPSVKRFREAVVRVIMAVCRKSSGVTYRQQGIETKDEFKEYELPAHPPAREI